MFGINKDECWNSDYDSTWEDDEPPNKMLKPQHWHNSGNRSARDMQRYRHGYDEADLDTADDPDSPEEMPNLLFYQNQIEFQPCGETIEDIYGKWWDDYRELEANHSYIQWLFPLREPGVNPYAIPLTQAEIKRMRADEVVMQRLLKSYKLMLGFYGIQLLDEKTGEVSRAAKWEERYHNLNRRSHNNLRITRILKCLGEMGYDHLQAPLVQFFLEETLRKNQLPNVKKSVLDYFMFTVKDKQQRRRLVHFAWENYTSLGPFIWGPVEKLQNLTAKKVKENEGTTEEMESKEENPGPPCKDLHQHLQHQTTTEDMGDDSRSGVGRIQDHEASEQRDAVTRSRDEQQTTEDNSSGTEQQITEDSSPENEEQTTEDNSSGTERQITGQRSYENEQQTTEDNSSGTEQQMTEDSSPENEQQTTEDNSSGTEQQVTEDSSPENEQQTTEDNSSGTEQQMTEDSSPENEQQTTEDNSSATERQITGQSSSENEQQTTEDHNSGTEWLMTKDNGSENEQLKTENNSLRNESPITEVGNMRHEQVLTEDDNSVNKKTATERTSLINQKAKQLSAQGTREDNAGLITAETSSVNKNMITRTTQDGAHQAEGSENEEKEKLMSGQDDRTGNNGIIDYLLSFGGLCCLLCCVSRRG
ncbi:uncharacterized protein LOC143765825 [Ranitomeya variabilis]|uniref:uncharacterized protein LOC143765825 n=1 Tax=Ranitomeya variabilis TaxID=490064 RepID=UPI004055ECEB